LPNRLNRLDRFCLFVIITMIFFRVNSAFGDSFSLLNKKGNKTYKRAQELLQKGEKNEAVEALEEALKFYRDAEIEKPESPELSYNLGNVMYQQEKYQDGLERYFKALSSDELQHQAQAYYNLGNTFYRSGKYPEAIQAYQKCLELTPDDEDAKYNLEFVRKKMKEMLDKELQRQQNQKQQQSQSEQQKPQQQTQEQQKPQEDQSQTSQPEEDQKQKEQKQEQLKPKEGMTKEDAERILNALKDDEKELLKKQKGAPQGRGRRGGKDW
jgi:Ca-activated chloride channel family protein